MGSLQLSHSISWSKVSPAQDGRTPPFGGSRRAGSPTWRRSRLVAGIARSSRPAMARIWSDEGKLRAWLDVELAATAAWAELGVVPAAAAQALEEGAVPPSPE